MNVYLFRHPHAEDSAKEANPLVQDVAEQAKRVGRFLSLMARDPLELITGTEQVVMGYAKSMVTVPQPAIRYDWRLCKRLDMEPIEAHRARVCEWFDAAVAARMNEDRTLAVVAGRETVSHVLACFLGSLEHSLTKYVVQLGGANFHLIRSSSAEHCGSLWKVEYINASF